MWSFHWTVLYFVVCVCVCDLVGTHGHGDILLGDLIVSNVPHVISCQLQDVRRDVLQDGDHVHGHLVVDLIAQHLLKHSTVVNTLKAPWEMCVSHMMKKCTLSRGWILSTGSASGFLLLLFSMAL